MVFTTDKRPDLRVRVTRLGRTIEFKNGRYETDDRVEIAALRSNRYVTEGEPDQPKVSAPAKVDIGGTPDEHRAAERAEQADEEQNDGDEDDAGRWPAQ